jgi:hypothetical protein
MMMYFDIICEVLKAQASSWQFDTLQRKEKKNYEVDLMSLKNLGLNIGSRVFLIATGL